MAKRLQNIETRRTPEGKRIYKYLKYPEISLSENDMYITTRVGDRLDLLADQFYNNVDYWWIIANANPNVIRRDSYNIKPGIEIRIPSNPENSISSFKKINEPE
jgi:hypothetical protein